MADGMNTFRYMNPDGSWSEFDLNEQINWYNINGPNGYEIISAPAPGAASIKPMCMSCPNELSETLDAYYGRDPRGKDLCKPCRERLKIP